MVWVEKPSANTRAALLKQRQEINRTEITKAQNHDRPGVPVAPANPASHHSSKRRGRTRSDMMHQRRSEHMPPPSTSNQVRIHVWCFPFQLTQHGRQGDGEDGVQRWSTKRWTDVVIDFREPRGNPSDLLDENGKERVGPCSYRYVL